MRDPAAPMPQWGARLCRKLRKDGYNREEIARIIGYSLSTVKRVFRYFKEHDEDRVPRPGTGKSGDVRWIFAGSNGERNLTELDRLKERGDDADTLKVPQLPGAL
jgi:hypothetical protein